LLRVPQPVWQKPSTLMKEKPLWASPSAISSSSWSWCSCSVVTAPWATKPAPAPMARSIRLNEGSNTP
jgi:hypothetical protein